MLAKLRSRVANEFFGLFRVGNEITTAKCLREQAEVIGPSKLSLRQFLLDDSYCH